MSTRYVGAPAGLASRAVESYFVHRDSRVPRMAPTLETTTYTLDSGVAPITKDIVLTRSARYTLKYGKLPKDDLDYDNS